MIQHSMENYHTLSPHVKLCHNMAENIDKCNAMNTVGQCTTGDDPQCNAEMQNASAQCEQGGRGGERQVRRIDNG